MKSIKIECEAKECLELKRLKIVQKDLKDLDEDRYKKLRNEIINQGFSFAIHVWPDPKDGMFAILDGTQRMRVLQSLIDEGYEVPPIPVVFVMAKSYKAAIRKLLGGAGMYGKPTKQGLYELLEMNDIKLDEIADIELPGIDLKDFEVEYYEEEVGEGGEEIPTLENAKSKTGDLWTLGKHRLLCGSSLDQRDVAKVLNGSTPAVCITDPPYCVDYEESHRERGGDPGAYEEKGIDVGEMLQDFLGNFAGHVVVMTFPVDRHFQELAAALAKTGFEVRKELVWVKDSFSFWMGAKYQQKHEPILIIARKGKPVNADVPSNQTTVLEFPRPKCHDLHPTAKPLELWQLLVKYHVDKGKAVYEPFSGSGTTLIAAQKLNRVCYAIEKSPQYVDVALQRWAKLTGQDPVREDGVTWSSLNRAQEAN